MAIDTQPFKAKLDTELKRLEEELATVGRKNPLVPGDWEATSSVEENSHSDTNEVADSMEHFEENTAILEQLEIQLKEVRHALDRISEGTYGTCEVCGAEIEADRLEANPSARTCKAHMN